MPFMKYRPKISNTQRLEILASKNGLRHSIFTVHHDRYKGEWKNNQKSGKGAMLTRSFRLYEGDWERDYRHGFGVFAFRTENKIFVLIYRGDWKNGRMSGFGAYHYPDGSYYLGNWKNNKRHGYGQMWYADGSFYDGDWRRDLKHGLGMFVRIDGNRYEGAWMKDLKHGAGRFFHLDSGQMQEGVWQNDICVYSTIIDIPFRQKARVPTEYPIQMSELVHLTEVCDEQQLKALSGQIKSCLSFSTNTETIEDKSTSKQ